MERNALCLKQIIRAKFYREAIVTQKVYRHQLKPVITMGATAMNSIFIRDAGSKSA